MGRPDGWRCDRDDLGGGRMDVKNQRLIASLGRERFSSFILTSVA